MKKQGLLTYALIAGAVVAAVLVIRKMNKDKKRTSSVTADSPIVQTESEFMQDQAQAPKPTPIESVSNIIKTIFPKRTTEQKAQIKATRTARIATRKAKRKTKVAGFDDLSVLC